jgi:hypothetical protein
MQAVAASVPDAWAVAGLNTGLISYWSMRTSGTTVYDEWGNNDGTAVNTPTFSAGNGVRDDGAGLAAASSEWIDAGTGFNFQTTNSFTFSAWIKTAGPGGIVRKWDQNSKGGYIFEIRAGGNNKITFAMFNATASAGYRRMGSTTVTDNSWRHVAMAYDGSKSVTGIRLWVNGTEESYTAVNNTDPGALTSSTIYLGNSASTATPVYFDGAIDEVAIWNRALTSNEVYQVYSTPLYAPYRK